VRRGLQGLPELSQGAPAVLSLSRDGLDRLLVADGRSFAPQTAIRGVDGLPELLDSARKEEPLDGWGGIKVATEDDLRP